MGGDPGGALRAPRWPLGLEPVSGEGRAAGRGGWLSEPPPEERTSDGSPGGRETPPPLTTEFSPPRRQPPGAHPAGGDGGRAVDGRADGRTRTEGASRLLPTPPPRRRRAVARAANFESAPAAAGAPLAALPIPGPGDAAAGGPPSAGQRGRARGGCGPGPPPVHSAGGWGGGTRDGGRGTGRDIEPRPAAQLRSPGGDSRSPCVGSGLRAAGTCCPPTDPTDPGLGRSLWRTSFLKKKKKHSLCGEGAVEE